MSCVILDGEIIHLFESLIIFMQQCNSIVFPTSAQASSGDKVCTDTFHCGKRWQEQTPVETKKCFVVI